MPEYILIIKIPNAGNRELTYSVNLMGTHEPYPEDFFMVKENRLCLCQTIENELARPLNNSQLDRIIAEWTRDIKDGYRRTSVTLDIPPEAFPKATPNTPQPLGGGSSEIVTDSFSQSIASIPRTPRDRANSQTVTKGSHETELTISPPEIPIVTSSPVEDIPPKEPETKTGDSDTWASGNKADF